MSFASVDIDNNIAVVTMNRGKVHAVNAEALVDLRQCFETLRDNSEAAAVLLTGSDKFFSFGFDVPELLEYSRSDLREFLLDFNHLLTDLFLFPKPLIGALNGHTVAGGCMLALTADNRIMAETNAKMSLNEINIGASVFAGPTEMLRFCVGSRMAERVLTGGEMFGPEEAASMGLVDRLVRPERLIDAALERAEVYAAKNAEAFRSIKNLLRKPVVDSYQAHEEASVDEFIDIWLSEGSQAQLRQVEIRR